MKCSYCGSTDTIVGNKCNRCGGAIEKTEKANRLDAWYWRGFMVWPEHNPLRDEYIYHIWAGERLIADITITRPMFDAYHDKYGENICEDDLVEKMLKLAIGESEFERIEVQNNPRNLLYEMRVIENKELLEARELMKEIGL